MDKVYKIIEVVGCSQKNYEEAVQNAVAEAGKTLKGLAWFEVKEWRGGIKNGKVTEFQAVTKVGFRLIED
jgi:flavin-binding protein dodecin